MTNQTLPGIDALFEPALTATRSGRRRMHPQGLAPLNGEACDWRQAQALLAAELAAASIAFGALDERLRTAGGGPRLRLAVAETALVLRAAGDRVPADRLVQLVVLPGPFPVSETPALRRAIWTLRCLAAAPAAHAQGLPDLDDLPEPALRNLPSHPGDAWLHPFVRAARVWQAGTRETGADPGRHCTSAVMAARLASAAGRGFAAFVPAAMGGAAVASDSPEEALADWLAAAEAGCHGALGLLDRLAAWRARAEAATASLTGRTPGRLIAVLSTWPVVSAPFAEAETSASRAAVQRNLDRLAERGLIREITGQGRYRLWTAAH